MADAQTNNANQQQLMLQKIYVKDLSFESPKAPMVFTTNVQPQTEINIRSGSSEVAADTHEVSLTLTIEAKDNGATLFLAEVVQAGIFLVQGYSNEERGLLLGSFCPSTLYPFAREAVADLVQRGGFPQLLLQPINFDALYQQAMQERASRESGAAVAAPAGSAGTH